MQMKTLHTTKSENNNLGIDKHANRTYAYCPMLISIRTKLIELQFTWTFVFGLAYVRLWIFHNL